MAKTRKCRQCKQRYAEDLIRCPYCQTRAKGGSRLERKSRAWVSVVVIVVALAAIAAAVLLVYSALNPGFFKKDKDKAPQPTPGYSQTVQPEETGEEPNVEDTGEPVTTPDPEETPVSVDSIVLGMYEAKLDGPGDTVQLSADIYPAAAQGLLKWESSDTDVAVVDEDGLVTAVGDGTVKIVARAGGKSASCIVTVGETPVSPEPSESSGGEEEIVLKIYNLYFTAATFSGEQSINVGEKVQMYVDVNGVRTTEGVTWSTDNSSVASIDSDGEVTGVGTGRTIITATYKGQSVKCICHVR